MKRRLEDETRPAARCRPGARHKGCSMAPSSQRGRPGNKAHCLFGPAQCCATNRLAGTDRQKDESKARPWLQIAASPPVAAFSLNKGNMVAKKTGCALTADSRYKGTHHFELKFAKVIKTKTTSFSSIHLNQILETSRSQTKTKKLL